MDINRVEPIVFTIQTIPDSPPPNTGSYWVDRCFNKLSFQNDFSV